MEPKGYHRRLAAILSADVAGYSRLMQDDEAATVKTLEAHKQIFSDLIQQHRGRVVDSPGDNLLAEFASVVEAVQCAVAVQKELQARNSELPENRRMQFRIGVNLGDVIEEGARIYGDGVNIAARLESLADPGGICISKTAFDQIESKLPFGYEFIGEQMVKNMAKPVGAYRIILNPRVIKKTARPKVLRPLSVAAMFCAGIVLLAIGGAWVWHVIQPVPVDKADPKKMVLQLPDKPSIAVLPFVNMSDDPKQEFFCDGIAEEIITGLSRSTQLFVVARDSSYFYKGKAVKTKQVSEELGVQYVLRGSVQREGHRIRVTVQLADALSGYEVWADRYDRPFKDLLALQDEITIKIMSALHVKMGTSDDARVMAKGANNLEAYLKAMEARERISRNTIEDNAIAKKLSQEAIELDPNYSRAYTLLAAAYAGDVNLGTAKSPKESMVRAIELTRKAISLDESDGKPHAFLGRLYGFSGEYDKGLTEIEIALSLDPSSSETTSQSGAYFVIVGKFEEAISLLQKAVRTNPHAPATYYRFLSIAYRETGRLEEAVSYARQAAALAPGSILPHVYLTAALSDAGIDSEAKAAAAEVLRINPRYSIEQFEKTAPYRDKALTKRYADSLRKAGIPDKPLQ